MVVRTEEVWEKQLLSGHRGDLVPQKCKVFIKLTFFAKRHQKLHSSRHKGFLERHFLTTQTEFKARLLRQSIAGDRVEKCQIAKSTTLSLLFHGREFPQFLLWCVSAVFRFSPWMRMASKGHKALTRPLTAINFCQPHSQIWAHKEGAQIQTRLLFTQFSADKICVLKQFSARMEGFSLICSRASSNV